jgi:two-component system, chemotaxis family, response regulator PixG
MLLNVIQQHYHFNMESLLFQELRALTQSRFSGCLTIKNGDGKVISFVGDQTWQLFFYQGKMIGDSGGIHPIKRWQHCLQNEIAKFPSEIDRLLRDANQQQDRSDQLMRKLLAKSILNYQNVQGFISNSLAEVLFDIYQNEVWAWAKNVHTNLQISLSYERQFIKWNELPDPEVVVPTEMLLRQLTAAWQEWQAKNLLWYSPHLSPYLTDRQQLQQTMEPDAYLEMIQLLDGQKTFQDIAIELNQDVSTLTTSLINKKENLLLAFEYVPEQTLATQQFITSKTVTYRNIPESTAISIVGAVIDSELDLYRMQQIALLGDYGYVGCQDPQQAAAIFLENCPQLIFVDMVLGDMTGYEVCSSLRRLPQLKKTPIILLTTNPKEQKTMRSRIAGVTAFLLKPLEPREVLSFINQCIFPKV